MKRLITMVLALALLAALCLPALATANGTWDEGYEAGLADGAAGFANGDAKRYKEQMSIAQGYDGGYAEGYLKGWWEAWKNRPDPTDYERGFGDGYRVGWKDAEETIPYDRTGRSEQFSGEYRKGFMEGYDDGYSEALDEIYEYALHHWDGDFEPLEQPLIVNGWPFKGTVALRDGVAYISVKTLNEITGAKLKGDVVPLRETAAQLGWDTVWNKENRQVVMLSKKRLLEQALSGRAGRPAPDFGALDKLLNKAETQGFGVPGVHTAEGTLTVNFSAFSTLDKEQSSSVLLQYTTVSDGRNFHTAATFNGADLAKLLTQMKVEGMAAVKSLPSGSKLELIVNGNNLYFSAPFLASLDNRFAGADWTHIALPDMGANGNHDTAEWLYQRMLAESRDGKDPMQAYQDFARDCVVLDALGGPEVLSEQDGTFVWKVDAAKVNEALGRLLGNKGLKLFRECNITAKLAPNGWNNYTLSIRPNTDQLASVLFREADKLKKAAASWVLNLLDVRLAMQADEGPESSSETGELHWKNNFRLNVEGRSTSTAGGELILTPPEGAVVVDY